MAKNKKKADYTEHKSSICKTSWLQIFEAMPKTKEELAKAGKSIEDFRRKATFMFPKTIDAIELKISDAGKQRMVDGAKKYLKELKTAALKLALLTWDSCETAQDLEDEGVRWNPVLDGDSRKMVKAYEGNKGYFLVRAGTGFKYGDAKRGPFIYNAENEVITEKGIFKSGDWVKAFLTLYAYHGEQEGLTAGMNNIKKCYTGTYTGVSTADFEEDEDELEELEVTEDEFDSKEKENEDEDW